MIKPIIQKIILSNFGKFINGIERDKLSVDLFQGNFKLQNISLNHQYFDNLNTPFKLAFSSIGKLNLQAPLTKLSSVPVECILDNIYVIFQFKPNVSQKDKEQIFLNKKNSIKVYIKEIFKTYLGKMREQKKEDGMMAKLGKKILDNLQLKIVNLHVRFQESSQIKYGWGVTLEEVSFTTTNDEWKSSFVDRQKQKQNTKNEKLFKKMNVKNFNIYWQSAKTQEQAKSIIIKNYQNDKLKQIKLQDMIKQKKNIILSITSQFKLIINAQQNLQVPLYELSIDLEPIKFELDRAQVIQIIDFIQKNIVQNQMILHTLRKSKKQKCSQEQKKTYKIKYIEYIALLLGAQNNTVKPEAIQTYEQKQQQELQTMFNMVETEELMEWSLPSVKKLIKQIRQEDLKKKKKGWFGSGNIVLSEEELIQMEKYIESTFDLEQTARPQDCLYFCFKFVINGGNFRFVDRKSTRQEDEFIQFAIGKIQSSISKSSNQSFLEFRLSIESIGLSLYLPQLQQDNSLRQVKLQILKNQNLAQSEVISDQKFIQIVFRKNVKINEKNTKVLTQISGQVSRLIFTYKKLYFKKFKHFFTFKNFNQYMKTSTIEKLQHIKQKQVIKIEEAQDKIQKIFSIDFSVISPKIICPFNQNQCWCFSLGDLKLLSQNSQQVNRYPMKITSAYLKYYNNIELCHQQISSHSDLGINQAKNNRIFSVLNDMNFSILYEQNRKQKSEYTQIQLPEFQLNFTRHQYQNLITISKIFQLDEEQKTSIIQQLKKTRLQIQEQKLYQGQIMKKNQTLRTWKKYYAILSGEHIYFYDNKKQLREIEKTSIKNSQLFFKIKNQIKRSQQKEENQKLKSNENNLELQLISQHEYCHFYCQKLQDLEKWKIQIQNKAKQFKTMTQLMEFYGDQNQDNSKQRKRSVSEQLINQKAQRHKITKIKISKVGFIYKDSKNFFKVQKKKDFQQIQEQQHQTLETLMNFQIHQILVQNTESPGESKVKMSLNNIKITDGLYLFKNQKFQPFVTLDQCVLLIDKSKNNSSRKDKNMKVRANLGNLKVNWKPDVIIIFLDLIKKHFSQQKKFRIDDETQKSRKEHFSEIQQDAKYMFSLNQYLKNSIGIKIKQRRDQFSKKNKFIREVLNLELKIQEAEAYFIHRQSHLVMFRVEANSIHSEFVLGESQRFISGSVHYLALDQMSMYPQKSYSPDDDLTPYRIAKPKNQQKNDNSDNSNHMIKFFYSAYDPQILPNQQKIDSFFQLVVQPVELIYFQQTIFRLIDYSLIQIMLLITQPQMLTANQNLMDQIKKNQQVKEKPIRILFSQYEQIIKKLINPFFMDMNFYLKSPSLIVKSQKTSLNYYAAEFQDLKFQNRQTHTQNRFSKCKFAQANSFIYQEQYIITGNKMNFNLISEDAQNNKITKQKFFGPVQIELIVNKLCLQDQLNLIFPQFSENPSYQYDRSFVTQCKISNIVIPHCSRFEYLSLNKLVNFNFLYDDECDQLFIHNFKITKMLLPKPIVFGLTIDKVCFDADYSLTKEKQYKLFNAQISKFQMKYLRKKDLNSEFVIKMGGTNIIGYEYVDGDFQKSQKMGKQLSYSIIQHQLVKISCSKEELYSSEIVMDNRTTGEKAIQMTMRDLNVVVKSGLLQLIFQYTMLQDWVFPTINKIVTQLTFYSTIQNMVAIMQDNPQVLFQKNATSVQQILQHSQKLRSKKSMQNIRMIKLIGVFCYKFHRKKGYSNQYLKQMLQQNQITVKKIQDMPEATYQNLLFNTEMFHCYKHTSQQRRIMEKFTLSMTEKRFIKVANLEEKVFKNAITRTFNFDKCYFKVSVMDLLLMKQMVDLMGIERQYITTLNKKVGKVQQKTINNRQSELSSLQSMDILIESVSFYLINSWNQIFIPIMHIKIDDVSMFRTNTFKKDIIKGELSLAVYYFNSSIFKWEPVLERASFNYFRQIYFQQSIKKFGGLQCLNAVSLNISKQMFMSIRQCMAAFQKQSQVFKNRLFNQLQSKKQPLQFISHYIIKNQTGYDVQIYCNKALKYRLKHNEQVDHQLELHEYNEQLDLDVIISFRIMHPRHKFKFVSNVSVNAQKEYIIDLPLIDGKVLPNHKIMIQPKSQSLKQYLIIGSLKKIEEYFDNFCKVTVLPFDTDKEIELHQNLYNMKKVSLYQTYSNHYYRFVGKDGIVKIMPNYLVYNYTPIPLMINQKEVLSNQYVGVFQKPTIQTLKLKDSMLKIDYNEKQRHYYIYCEAYIVDYYGLCFQFGNSSQNKKIKKIYSHQNEANGYKHWIYILPEADCKFKVKMDQQSIKFSTLKPAIGRFNFDLQKGSALCNFSSYCYLNPCKNQHINQFNRVIEITPRYVLSNTTKSKIKICQRQSMNSMLIQSHQRCPFFWENIHKPKQIKIALFDDTQLWGYSGPLTIEASTQTVVLRKVSDPSSYKIISIHIQPTSTITMIHIIQSYSKYMLCNQVTDCVMTVYQTELTNKVDNDFMTPNEFVFNLKYKDQKPFGYQLPLSSHKVTVQIQLNKQCSRYKGRICHPIQIADIQTNLYEIQVPIYSIQTKKKEDFLILSLQFEGNIKKLKLVYQTEEQIEELDYQYSIKIPMVGISLIGYQDSIRKQVIYALFNKIQLDIKGNQQFIGYELLIRGLRIQSQLKVNAIFPTLLQSYQTKLAKYFMQFILKRDSKNSRFIKSIGLSITRSVITLTSEQVQIILQTIEDIMGIKINEQKVNQNLMIRQYELFSNKNVDVEQSYYFQQAQIQPLKFVFTFKHVNDWGGKLLKTFSSINECNVSVDGKKINHFNAQNIATFIKFVQEHYKEGISKMILPMIGNLTILGSPLTLVQKIGSGVKDFIQLPAEQFQNGPLEVGKGIAKGTKSLVKNTFQGAMNTVQSLTGSIGNGLSVLVDDEQFSKKRQSIRNQRTQHVGDGLKNGAKSIFNGFSKGFTGLITQPVRGAQKDGLPGFLLGSLKGLSGLIIKPVSGIIDATTKTAQGIKNTANFLSPEQRQKRLKRVHNPRPFYGHCRQFHSYDKYLSDICKLLQKQKYSLTNLQWVGYFMLVPKETKQQKSKSTKNPLLLVTYEHLIIYDLKNGQIKQQYYTEDIIEAQDLGQNKLRLIIMDRKHKNKQGHISMETDGSNMRLVRQINKLVKFYRPKFIYHQ